MMFHSLKSINKNQRGFTLIELIVALAITALIIGGVVMGVFHIFNINALSSNHMKAVRQVQNAGYWINHDVLMAQSVAPALADPDGFPLYASWENSWETTLHEVTYTLMSNGDLKRSYRLNGGDPSEIVVAQFINVDSLLTKCEFSVSGGKFVLKVTATVGSWPQPEVETRVYEIIPRPG